MTKANYLLVAILVALTGCVAPMGSQTSSSDKAGTTYEGYFADGKGGITVDCDGGACDFFIHVKAVGDLYGETPIGISVSVPNNDYAGGEATEIETRDGVVEGTLFATKLTQDTPYAAVGVTVRDSAKVVISGDVTVDLTTRSDRRAPVACRGLCETPKFPGAFKVRSSFGIWDRLSDSDAEYDRMEDIELTYEDSLLIGEMPRTLPGVFAHLDSEPFRFLTQTALLELSDNPGDEAAVARVAARELLRAGFSEARDVWEEALTSDDLNITDVLAASLERATFVSTIDVERGTRRLEGIEFTNTNRYFADIRRYFFGGDVHETNLEMPTDYRREEAGISFSSTLDMTVIGSLVELVLGEVVAKQSLASDQPGVGVDALMSALFTSCDHVSISSSLLDTSAARTICAAGQAGLRDHLNGILSRAVYQAYASLSEGAHIHGGTIVTDVDDGQGALGQLIPYSSGPGRALLAIGSGDMLLMEITGDVSVEPAEIPGSEPAL